MVQDFSLSVAFLALALGAGCGSSDKGGSPAADASSAGKGATALAGSGSSTAGTGGTTGATGGSDGNEGGSGDVTASGTGGSGGSGGSGGTGGSSGSGGAGKGGGAGTKGSGGSAGAVSTKTYPPGPPGCGLDAAAFCETFDKPAGKMTRAGELDPARFSAARMCNIGGPTNDGQAVGIAPGTLPTCRSGLPAQVSPDQDALVCDGNDSLQSNHLLVVVAAQNYGQNSYRIRQPFDFAGRTGKIVFDAEGYNVGLYGWISLEITEDPTPAPSFTLQQNYENGAIPRNAIEIQLAENCNTGHVGVSDLLTYSDFVQNDVYESTGATAVCAVAAQDKLNRFTVEISQNHVEILATDASDDGVTFGTPISLLSKDVDLPFTRGYVHLTTHNHATLKYSEGMVDAWTSRWDNVGFDGPAIVGAFREYEAPDSLIETPGMVSIGYRLGDVAMGPAQQIQIPDVDLTGATSAQIALEMWSLHAAGTTYPSDFALNYRLNGHDWHASTLSASEIAMVAAVPNAGTRSTMLDVDVAELVKGANVLELTTTDAPTSYVPAAFNIDLILSTQ